MTRRYAAALLLTALAFLACALAHAQDISMSARGQGVVPTIDGYDLPVAAGSYADITIAIANHASVPAAGLSLELGGTSPTEHAYRYEQRSAPACGELVPEAMRPSTLRAALADIPAGGELACTIRVHRDADLPAQASANWGILAGDAFGPGGIVRLGTFANVELASTVVSRSVSNDGIRTVVRLTATNRSPFPVTAIASSLTCEPGQIQQVVAGSCTKFGAGCPIGVAPGEFLQWPSIASGASAQCDLASTVTLADYPPWAVTAAITRAFDADTGEAINASLGDVPWVTYLAYAQVDLDQRGIGGTWASPATSAQGLVLDVSPDARGEGTALAFGGWFTYAADGSGAQHWYTVQADVAGTRGGVGIYESLGGAFASARAATTQRVGNAIISFADCNHGQFAYSFDGTSRHGSIALVRVMPGAACGSGATAAGTGADRALAGTWADPSTSSQGLVLDVDPAAHVLFGGWFTYPASGDDPQRWFTLQGTLDGADPRGTNLGLYESTGGAFDDARPATTVRVGDADIALHDCMHATLAYRFTSGSNANRSGTLALARLGPSPAECPMR